MRFNMIDTQAIYRRLLATTNAAQREEIFRNEVVAPLEGLSKVFGGGDAIALFRQWGMSADQVASDRREWFVTTLDQLAANDAWGKTALALDDAQKAFAPYADRIPLDLIQFALVIADTKPLNPLDRGYTGFGGVPGYILVVYGEANDYALKRIQGATVHELHHNIRFKLFPFTMQISVGDYIVAEGMAESLAVELYGEEVVGYYVTDFSEQELETAKRMIGGALNVTGFNEVRSYIFGDVISEMQGRQKMGIPNYAGYAIGYRVVQQYLRRSGKTVPEATFVPADQIIAESGFFA
jgi:uncharacterized protein YjaZ